MTPKKLRVFIAHSKSDPASLLDTLQERVRTTLVNAGIARGVATEVECVLGRDDHRDNFKRAGSWDAWAWDVIDRIDYVTRAYHYDAIVVTNEYVGAATAKIVERAFASRRCILLFCADGVLRPVREIEQVSSDFRQGWQVIAS